MSGTEGMKKQQALLKKHFEERGATVEFQRFTARQESQRKPVDMANLIASWHPERARHVILCAHYDTRPIADQEENIRKWHEPFLSANDGGSGLGLAIVIPIIILCLVVGRVQSLRETFHRVPLWLLVAVHIVRLLGISFIILYTSHRLPAPFAPVAGWGDIFVGATAVPVAWFAYRRPSNAPLAIWIWNAIGAFDLIAAVGLGVISSPGPQRLIFAEPSSAIMTTVPWLLIPGFLVPLLFAIHVGIFARIARSDAA